MLRCRDLSHQTKQYEQIYEEQGSHDVFPLSFWWACFVEGP